VVNNYDFGENDNAALGIPLMSYGWQAVMKTIRFLLYAPQCLTLYQYLQFKYTVRD